MGPNPNVIAGAAVVLFVVAAVMFAFGRRLVGRIGCVKRMRHARQLLGGITLDRGVPVNDPFIAICHRVLHDLVSQAALSRNTVVYQYRQVGDLVEIVYYKERNLRRIVRELRTYAALVLVLGGLGFLLFLPETGFKWTGKEFWHLAGHTPGKIIAAFEAIMLLFFSVRLGIEVQSISELVDEV